MGHEGARKHARRTRSSLSVSKPSGSSSAGACAGRSSSTIFEQFHRPELGAALTGGQRAPRKAHRLAHMVRVRHRKVPVTPLHPTRPRLHTPRASTPCTTGCSARWTARPRRSGPHDAECLPVCLILRNRLKYALTGQECKQICMEKCGDRRQDAHDYNYPAGFMDVVEMEKTETAFPALRHEGALRAPAPTAEEASHKLCRGPRCTSARRSRASLRRRPHYPGLDLPSSERHDQAQPQDGRGHEYLKFDTGMLVTPTKGKNTGRWHIARREAPACRHRPWRRTRHLLDAPREHLRHRQGRREKPLVQLPKGKGICFILQSATARGEGQRNRAALETPEPAARHARRLRSARAIRRVGGNPLQRRALAVPLKLSQPRAPGYLLGSSQLSFVVCLSGPPSSMYLAVEAQQSDHAKRAEHAHQERRRLCRRGALFGGLPDHVRGAAIRRAAVVVAEVAAACAAKLGA